MHALSRKTMTTSLRRKIGKSISSLNRNFPICIYRTTLMQFSKEATASLNILLRRKTSPGGKLILFGWLDDTVGPYRTKGLNINKALCKSRLSSLRLL